MKLVSDDQTGQNHDYEYQKHGGLVSFFKTTLASDIFGRENDGHCLGEGRGSTSGRFGGNPS